MKCRKGCIFFIYILEIFGNIAAQRHNTSDPYDMSTYGLTWMYFPDGDEVPHRISFFMPLGLDTRRVSFTSDCDDIQFRLYTRKNPINPVIFNAYANPESENYASNSLSKKPIKMVTHGWESSADKNAVINIKNAYLEKQDVNVFGVDWSTDADSIMYPIVAFKTRDVGECVATFIDSLHDRYNVSGDQLHLIGHSLGAHVMGVAAAESNLKVARVTGLDPARPLFEFPSSPDSTKLDATDAKFVDIIHTCGGLAGVKDPIGHADFFPNEGSAPQPGCLNMNSVMEACSHSRAHFLFTESIRNNRAFPAYQCSNWTSYKQRDNCIHNHYTYLGEAANTSAVGTFYLETNDDYPYGRGL